MAEIIKFEDAVKQRIKEVVSDLIPEERWQSLVDNAIVEFEKVHLPKLVRDELTLKYQELIRAELAKPEWIQKYSNGNTLASEMVSKLIIESAPSILSGLIGGAVQQMIYDLQQKARY